MNFLQRARVAELTKLIVHWQNPDNMNAFYKNLPHFERANTGVGKFLEGYVTYYNNTLSYNDLSNGKTIILRNKWNDKDYVCSQELQEEAEAKGFRINKLTFREVVETGDGTFEYLEFDAPNNEYGTNFLHDTIVEGSLTKEYIKEYIDQYGVLLKAAAEVASRNECGVPVELGLIFDRFKDSTGYFWTEALDWSMDPFYAVDNQSAFLETVLKFRIGRSTLSDTDVTELLSYARHVWTQI